MPLSSHAVFTEWGLSGSYRKSSLDQNNYTETFSTSLSLGLHFGTMNAWELGYTQASSTQLITRTDSDNNLEPSEKIVALFDILSSNFILNFAHRQAAIQPFIKIGAAYFLKKRYELSREDFPTVTVIERKLGIGPNAGAGVKIAFSERFRFKISLNWMVPPAEEGEKSANDYSGRIGITWLL